MRERLTHKILLELDIIKNHRQVRFSLLFGLALAIFGTILRSSFKLNEAPNDIGIISSAIGSLLFIWGTTKYAKVEGRHFWAFMVVLFMPLALVFFFILFFLSPKLESKETPKPSVEKNDYLIILLLTFGLFAYSQINLNLHFTQLGTFNYGYPTPIWLANFILLSIVVVPIWALIKNKRKLLILSGWLMLIIFFVWLFLVPRNHAVDIYKVMRDQAYIYLIAYAILHLIIHGVYKIFKRERNWITPEGIFQWNCSLLFITFYYSLYDLLLKLF